MKQEIAEQWVAALRSGQYRQGTGRLCNMNNEFCVICIPKLTVGLFKSTVVGIWELLGTFHSMLYPGLECQRGTGVWVATT